MACVCAYTCLKFPKQFAPTFSQKPVISHSSCTTAAPMSHTLASVSRDFQIMLLVIPKRSKFLETSNQSLSKAAPDKPERWTLSKSLCFWPGMGAWYVSFPPRCIVLYQVRQGHRWVCKILSISLPLLLESLLVFMLA